MTFVIFSSIIKKKHIIYKILLLFVKMSGQDLPFKTDIIFIRSSIADPLMCTKIISYAVSKTFSFMTYVIKKAK